MNGAKNLANSEHEAVMRTLRALLIVLLLGLAFVITPALTAHAAAWVVNSPNDANDGACNATHCSLREAIIAANSNRGADTITFSLPIPSGIIVYSPLPTLTDNATAIRTNSGDVRLIAGVSNNRCGLSIRGSNIKIHGLWIRSFEDGICIGSTDPTLSTVGTVIGVDSDAFIDTTERVIITENNGYGIRTFGANVSQTVIAGNLIGLTPQNIDGPNQTGIFIDGATNTRIGTNGDGVSDALERNVISGNNFRGIYNSGVNTWIAGNYIGTSITGNLGSSNQDVGIEHAANNAPMNLIIGTNSDGQNDNVEGNVISGNSGIAIELNAGSEFIIAGNLIGTDATGQYAAPNGMGIVMSDGASNVRIGMDIFLPPDPNSRNMISGNTGFGIYIANDEFDTFEGIEIVSNYIGVAKDGLSALGNGDDGIRFANYARPLIASVTETWPNRQIIANNAGAGIHNTTAILSKNSIYENGGLGVDIGFPSSWLPQILSADHTGSSVTLNVQLDGFDAEKTWNIEFFASSSCDASGYGEGTIYFHNVTLTTDVNGNASTITTAPATFPSGWYVTAIATRQVYFPLSTEFSQCVEAN